MQNRKNWHKKSNFVNFCISHAANQNKTNESYETLSTERIKTCIFLTVRGRANKAELFLEPRKNKTKNKNTNQKTHDVRNRWC